MKQFIWCALVLAMAGHESIAVAQQSEQGPAVILGAMDNETTVKIWRRNETYVYSDSTGIYRPGGNHAIEKKIVAFDRDMEAGSILVKTGERKLYLVLPDGQALMYSIGVGKEGFQWNGTNKISRKAEWPDWRPPAAMVKREAEKGRFIPSFMPGGARNPLGARALYIGTTEFRIHGTTQPWSIGRAVSSGCIRMLNEHVIDLYDQVKVGARVVVE
jgi:lipoprotein-anchoring transpeptidase ErfK/SrfK